MKINEAQETVLKWFYDKYEGRKHDIFNVMQSYEMFCIVLLNYAREPIVDIIMGAEDEIIKIRTCVYTPQTYANQEQLSINISDPDLFEKIEKFMVEVDEKYEVCKT